MVNLNKYLKFKMPKTVTVEVWQVGLVNRICQILVLVYLLWAMVTSNSWALTEVPGGTSNSWPEEGDWHSIADTGGMHLPHCIDKAGFSYAYSPEFTMDRPECEVLHPYELAAKGSDRLTVTTAYIEYHEVGFPCSSGKQAECTGLTMQMETGQCYCLTSRTVYPVGVDEIVIAYEHGYTTTEAFNWWGSSSVSPGLPESVQSTVERPEGRTNKSALQFDSGSAIRLSLRGWLDAANVSLDDRNTQLSPDYRDSAVYPRMRSSGTTLTITTKYSNLGADGEPSYYERRVDAHVSVAADLSNWAGPGPLTHWEEYPKGVVGNQTYDKHTRYSMGVVFKFHSAGLVYRMEWVYLLNTLVNSLVLLSAASSVATLFALYCVPKGVSRMIRFDTRETFSVNARNAEIGMKAAISAADFNLLDLNNDGEIEMAELVRTFARIPGIEFEQAAAVARLVLTINNDKDEDVSEEMPEATLMKRLCCGSRAQTGGDQAAERKEAKLNFSEFMRGNEGGAMLKWKEYLKQVTADAEELEPEERQQLSRAFELERGTQAKRGAQAKLAPSPQEDDRSPHSARSRRKQRFGGGDAALRQANSNDAGIAPAEVEVQIPPAHAATQPLEGSNSDVPWAPSELHVSRFAEKVQRRTRRYVEEENAAPERDDETAEAPDGTGRTAVAYRTDALSRAQAARAARAAARSRNRNGRLREMDDPAP